MQTAAEPDANGHLPSFHFKGRLCLHLMPMFNNMPVRVRVPQAPSFQGGVGMMNTQPEHVGISAQQGSDGLGSTMFMDAHLVPGVTVEQAIHNTVHTMPFAMSQQELQLRRMVPETVIICMGRKMTHFEGKVDMETGCVDIDHVFTPRILKDQHLSKIQSSYDPNDS
jgi:hypothetical protein